MKTEEELYIFKHDVRNQLSNIILALENLKLEIEHPSEDGIYCLDTIANGCKQINSLVNEL